MLEDVPASFLVFNEYFRLLELYFGSQGTGSAAVKTKTHTVTLMSEVHCVRFPTCDLWAGWVSHGRGGAVHGVG